MQPRQAAAETRLKRERTSHSSFSSADRPRLTSQAERVADAIVSCSISNVVNDFSSMSEADEGYAVDGVWSSPAISMAIFSTRP